jgi:two-component system, chemotaxis family, protein-glutamate methylesterase/glutaminase
VGASAGGVEALCGLFRDLTSSLPVAFFVALHRSPNKPSWLPWILERTGRLPAGHPRDGDKIWPGRIYVAPSDSHLIVGEGVVHLSRGSNVRRFRPSIDTLFRSAARVYGQRVIGVLLSGVLDDGVEGLRAIKRNGGLTMVQAPAEAGFPDMPQHALARVKIDHSAPRGADP